MLLLFCFSQCLFSSFCLTVYDSDPIYSIKWYDSKDSLLRSYDFLAATGLHSTPDKEPSSISLNSGKISDQLASFSSINLKAAEKQGYNCYLPDEQRFSNHEKSEYSGPNPIELLRELLAADICSYLITSYWIYQLCHGKNFRQYHEEKSKTHEYFLGKLEEDWQKKQFTAAHDEKTWSSRLLGKAVVGEVERNAIEISMVDGTPCDIKNDKPREVIVKYICALNSRAELLSVQEIATCSYIAIASVPSLCRHPDFVPTERQETSIFCVAENKPVKLPTTASHNFHYVMGDEVIVEEFPGNVIPKQQPNVKVKIQTKLAQAAAEDEDDDDEEEEEDGELEARAAAAAAKNKNSNKNEFFATTEIKTPLSALMPDLKTGQAAAEELSDGQKANILKQLKAILRGQECVKGGRGYWNHEFCYNQYVHHVHYERDFETKQITIARRIILGKWVVKKHLEWIKSQPTGSYRNVYSKNPSITLYYSQGDMCFEINKPRHTLVKLRCLPDQKTSSRISVSLLEPTLCSYELNVDSGLFCELLKDVDENGIPNIQQFF